MKHIDALQTAQTVEKDFLDEKQLLARLPISRRTAFNWIQQGKLPVVKIGRRKLYHWKSVTDALLRIQKGAAQS
jgi:predicted site-specific integrase-resolvase